MSNALRVTLIGIILILAGLFVMGGALPVDRHQAVRRVWRWAFLSWGSSSALQAFSLRKNSLSNRTLNLEVFPKMKKVLGIVGVGVLAIAILWGTEVYSHRS